PFRMVAAGQRSRYRFRQCRPYEGEDRARAFVCGPRREGANRADPEGGRTCRQTRRILQSLASPCNFIRAATKNLCDSSRLGGERGVTCFHHKDAKTQRIAKNFRGRFMDL